MLRPTIYHEEWWLNAASAGAYEEVTYSSGGKVVGVFPFVIRKVAAGAMRSCEMPQLTHFLGPGIDVGAGAPHKQAQRRDSIAAELIRLLPQANAQSHKLHAGFDDSLIFEEAGFNSIVQFTFLIGPDKPEAIWGRMKDKTRNVIRRANEQHELVVLRDVDEFVSFYHSNIAVRGLYNEQNTALMRALCAAALEKERGAIVGMRLPDGNLSAAIFYVWDARFAYYHLSTRTPSAGNGAISALIWHAIQDASARGLTFDFDGVHTSGSHAFYRAFGGLAAPRYVARKSDRRFDAYEFVRSSIPPALKERFKPRRG